MAVLPNLQQTIDSQAELIAKLTAQLEKAKASKNRALTMKVSEKGGVSVYGLGKWPVTLYRSQWERLIAVAKAGEIDEFISENADLLKDKAD